MDTYAKRMWMMRARIFAWAECMTAYCAEHPHTKIMITLTYRKVEDYQAGHIHEFMKNVKQRLGSSLLAFAWVAELQARGAVHYHVMLVTESGKILPKPDDAGMWKYGMSRIEKARTFYYICTYLGKEYQKDLDKFPRSCRLYSASMRSDKVMSETFRALSNLVKGDREDFNDWEYVGATATEGYAELILDSHCAKI